nr:hypothetical protein CFP56_04328 [Quercus suber]
MSRFQLRQWRPADLVQIRTSRGNRHVEATPHQQIAQDALASSAEQRRQRRPRLRLQALHMAIRTAREQAGDARHRRQFLLARRHRMTLETLAQQMRWSMRSDMTPKEQPNREIDHLQLPRQFRPSKFKEKKNQKRKSPHEPASLQHLSPLERCRINSREPTYLALLPRTTAATAQQRRPLATARQPQQRRALHLLREHRYVALELRARGRGIAPRHAHERLVQPPRHAAVPLLPRQRQQAAPLLLRTPRREVRAQREHVQVGVPQQRGGGGEVGGGNLLLRVEFRALEGALGGVGRAFAFHAADGVRPELIGGLLGKVYMLCFSWQGMKVGGGGGGSRPGGSPKRVGRGRAKVSISRDESCKHFRSREVLTSCVTLASAISPQRRRTKGREEEVLCS